MTIVTGIIPTDAEFLPTEGVAWSAVGQAVASKPRPLDGVVDSSVEFELIERVSPFSEQCPTSGGKIFLAAGI